MNYKKHTRLTRQKDGFGQTGEKRSSIYSEKEELAKKNTLSRRARRAFLKMPTETQKRIIKNRQRKESFRLSADARRAYA